MERRLANLIRDAIRKAGVTPSEVARAAGVNKGAVSRFLRGERTITVETAELLLAALGCAVVIKRRKKS